MMKLMSIEDKARRLKQLEKIDFPSDQELDEIEQLKEELISPLKEKVEKAHEELMKSMEEKPEPIQVIIKQEKKQSLEFLNNGYT